MAILYINGESLEIGDITIQTPSFINTMSAWSTDFELPFGDTTMRALGINSFLAIAGQVGKTFDATLQVAGMSYPCVVRATALEDGKLKCWLSAQFFDTRMARRVCDIAAESGNDLFFQYFLNSDGSNYHPMLQAKKYECGSGVNESSGIMPSINAVDFVNYVCTIANIPVGNILPISGLYITPIGFLMSPLVKTLSATYRIGSDFKNYCSASLYAKDCKFSEVPLPGGSYIGRFSFKAECQPTSMDVEWRKPANDTMLISVNGVIVYSGTAGSGTTTASTTLHGINEGDMVHIEVIPETGIVRSIMSVQVTFNGVAIKTDRAGETYEPIEYEPVTHNWQGSQYLTYTSGLAWYTVGFLGCITQTFADVVNDLATMVGYRAIINSAGGLELVNPDSIIASLNTYKITAYDFAPQDVGKKTLAAYSNDLSDVLAEYLNDNLPDTAETYTLKAVKPSTVVSGGTEYVLWENYKDKTFIQGSNYMINGTDSNRLTPLSVASSLLPQGDVIGITARTPESFDSRLVYMYYRLWIVTEKTIDGNGITEFKALLYQ